MPGKNVNLHGSAPDKHEVALLVIDVINDFNFPEADQLLKHARPMVRNFVRLKRRAQKAGVPVMYFNDNSAVGNRTFAALLTIAHDMVAAAMW